MICESYPWKRDLMRRRSLILRYNTAEKLPHYDADKTYTIIEKAIFYSAFIIRKLIDCPGKMSDEVDHYRIKVEARTPLKKIDILNRWPDEDSHDWEHFSTREVDAKDVCNWLIHSFIFSLCTDESEAFVGFFVASDYDRNKLLYYVKLQDWITYIDFVASDSVVELCSKYDEKKRERVYVRKKRGSR